MGIRKFFVLPVEKKVLFVFLIGCAAAPFIMITSPTEIVSHTLHFWTSMYTAIPVWIATDKPFLQTFIACYGITSVGMAALYFGTFGTKVIFSWIGKSLKKRLEGRIRIPLKNRFLILWVIPKWRQFKAFIARLKTRLIVWLGRKSVWFIFGFVCLPVPSFNVIGTIAMGLKGGKYAFWILLLANVVNVFFLVLAYYLGIEFLLRLFGLLH